MSAEKAGTEVHHDISANENRPSHDIQYPVVAEGTGKTLDEAHGAKAKEVHNVRLTVPRALPATASCRGIALLDMLSLFIHVRPASAAHLTSLLNP